VCFVDGEGCVMRREGFGTGKAVGLGGFRTEALVAWGSFCCVMKFLW